jgi:glutaredoxin
MGVLIEVLEAGYCPKCGVVKERVLKLAAELGAEVKVIDPLRDPDRVVELNLLTSPAVVINGRVRFAGTVPSEEELRAAIEEEGG